MTEDQIERRVERMMDALDAQLMSGALTQGEYDSNVRDLDAWAEAKLREVLDLRKPYHWRGTINGV
jgi:hypothetical protein